MRGHLRYFLGVVCLVGSSWLWGQDAPLRFESGYAFRVREGRAYIAGFPAQDEVVVPLRLGGVPVGGCDERYVRYASLSEFRFRLQTGDEAFALVDGVLYSRDRKTLIKCPAPLKKGVYEVPAGTERIASGAFTGSRWLRSVTLPESLRFIGHEAFAQTGLRELALPKGVSELGEKAFADTELQAVDWRSSALRELPRGVFLNCRQLTSFTGGADLERLGDMAFFGCEKLSAVVLPEGVRHLGGAAFAGCRGLTSLRLPATLQTLGGEVFAECVSLSEVTVAGGNGAFLSTAGVLFSVKDATLVRFPPASSMSEYSIPGRIKVIAAGAFADCGHLKSVTLPPQLEDIGARAFRRGPVPENFGQALPESLRRIGVEAFAQTELSGTLKLPKSLQSLGSYAFAWTRLQELDVSELSLNALPTGLLEGCKALTSCRLPARMTSIGEGAFYGCTSLSQLELPRGMRHVGARALAHCVSLGRMALPEGLATIGARAFYGCRALPEVIFPNTVTELGDEAFAGCTGLVSAGLPRSLTTVRRGVFRGCSSLTAVSVPPSVKVIESTAFADCPKLEQVPRTGGK